MADEEQGTVLQVESNSQETLTEEQTQTADSETKETTEKSDSESKEITEGSADARTKEQIQESERFHQGVNTTLRETVSELTRKLSRLTPAKSVKSDDGSQKNTVDDTEEEYVNSTKQLKDIVDNAVNENFQKISSQATRNEQIKMIDETIYKFVDLYKIPDTVYNKVMDEYGGLVNLAIDNGGNIPKATEMFLHTLANEAGLERDSQKVDATKVATARKQKELREVQQPTASGGAPAIAPETEDDKIIKDLQKANRDDKFKQVFG